MLFCRKGIGMAEGRDLFMEKRLKQASCLIKTREYYVGFPDDFSHYPEGMDTETREYLHHMVIEAMQWPEDVSKAGGGVRRLVIGNGEYMVAGICGYLNHMMKDIADEYGAFCDFSGTRKSYGFVGLVWALDGEGGLPQAFPDLDALTEPLRREIVPHWKYSDSSLWAGKVRMGIETAFDFDIPDKAGMGSGGRNRLNTRKGKTAVFSSDADGMLADALAMAAAGQEISVCTDLEYNTEKGSAFMNLFSYGAKDDGSIFENPRRETTPEQEPVRQERSFWENGPAEETALEEGTVEIVCYFDCENGARAKEDFHILTNLFCNYLIARDGKCLGFREEKKRIFGMGRVVGKVIRYQALCPPGLPSGRLYTDLEEMLRNKQERGYLRTVELVGYAEGESAIQDDADIIFHDRLMEFLLEKAEKMTKYLVGEEKNTSSAQTDKGKELMQQLQELYGQNEKKTPPKNRKSGGNPFDL